MNDTRQTPGDIYMHKFDIYGEAFFDVSVISICTESYASKAAKGIIGDHICLKSKWISNKEVIRSFINYAG